jgi:hypothetical protein
MNRDDEFTHALEAWLRRKAPPQAPDRVLETALERVNGESQRQSWQRRLFGTTAMGSLLRVAAVTAVVALAVLAGQQLGNLVPDVGETSPSPSISAPSPSTSPSASPSEDCVNPPVDITSLVEAADPVACYGNAPITIEAEVIAGIADCPVVVEPAWLSCPQTFLMLVGETRKVGAPMLSVAVDPASGVSVGAPNTDVRVTGHFDDPAAQTCRETERPPQAGGTPEPAEATIEHCRRILVVTQVEPLAAGVPNVLGPDAFAHVVAGSVNVRTEPGLDSPIVEISVPDAPARPAVLGTAGGSEHVYILEGPVAADGFDWYRVAPITYDGIETIGPEFIGWMAAGDGADPWLVVENPCPVGPITLADLTYTSTTTNWATRLGCFRGQELTLRGWYPELPEGIGFEPCYDEPAFLVCYPGSLDIRPIEMSFADERNANRLVFAVNPDSGIVIPPRGQWIEITGHWDDPAAALCPTDTDFGTLSCRMVFVVTSIIADSA